MKERCRDMHQYYSEEEVAQKRMGVTQVGMHVPVERFEKPTGSS